MNPAEIDRELLRLQQWLAFRATVTHEPQEPWLSPETWLTAANKIGDIRSALNEKDS